MSKPQSIVPPWPHNRDMTPAPSTPQESEYFAKMNQIHQQFQRITMLIKMTLQEIGRVTIVDLTYIKREEIKTILDIFEAFSVPLFDHFSLDVWKRKDKKALKISIDKIRVQLHEAREDYNLLGRPNRTQYDESKIYNNLNEICAVILYTIVLVTEPRLAQLHTDQNEALTPLKQLISFETVLLLFPSFTTYSDKFLRNKFAPLYSRIHHIQSIRK